NLARAELELVSNGFEAGVMVHVPFFEALNHQVSDALGVVDRCAARCQLRAAAKAGAKAVALGLLRVVEEATVRFLRRPDGADGAAVDARGGDAYEKDAVKARV